MASYKAVLKQVADSLSPDDIDALQFSLSFNAAKKASIKTGIHLIQEMERQAIISEDDLSRLEQLLEEHELKQLANAVRQFVQKKNQLKKGSQSVEMTSERKSSGSSLQMDTGLYSKSQSRHTMQSMLSQHSVWTPHVGFHGNQHDNYATPNMAYDRGTRMQQQGCPEPNNWEYQPASPNYGTGTNFLPGPTLQSNGNQHGNNVTSHTAYYGGPGMQQHREYPPASPNYGTGTNFLPGPNLQSNGNQHGINVTSHTAYYGGPGMQQHREYPPASPNYGTGTNFLPGPNLQSNGNQHGDNVTSHTAYYGGPGMQQHREYPPASPNYGTGTKFLPGASLQSNSPATLLSHDCFPQQSTHNQQNFLQDNLHSQVFSSQKSMHNQQNFPQSIGNQVKIAPNKYQQQGPSPAQPHNQCNTQQNGSESKKICNKSNSQKPPSTQFHTNYPNIPHHTTSTANPGGLVPQSSEENQSSDEDGQHQFEEVFSDTPVGLLENIINDLTIADNHEPTSKVLVSTKEDHEQDNSQSHNATNQETPSSQVELVTADGKVIVEDQDYGTAKVLFEGRPDSEPSLTFPVQPNSAIYDNTHTSTKQPSSFPRWRQDGRKVDGFERDGYMLKIITNPVKAEHYETSEGCFVLLPWGSEYKIYMGNKEQHRCAVEVTYDGQWAGEFELLAERKLIIERPTIEDRKFCFIKPESALPGSGVSVDNPDNGIVSATFSPEKRPAYINDLKRGLKIDRLGTDYLELDVPTSLRSDSPELVVADSLAFTTEGQGISPELVVADALAFTTEGQGISASEDVQRGFIGGGPSKDWRSGATALMGHSDQQFVPADNFELDDSRKVLIQLRLVGLKG